MAAELLNIDLENTNRITIFNVYEARQEALSSNLSLDRNSERQGLSQHSEQSDNLDTDS